MLHFYVGTDREKAKDALDVAVKKIAKKGTAVLHISDANSLADLSTALQGRGMFDSERVIVLDSVFANEEMQPVALNSLPLMKKSTDHYFVIENKLDAATKKQIEKYAEDSFKFDAPKKEQEKTIFKLANALRTRDKKALWVGYQRELLSSAPEAIHGVLFWAAKQMLLGARADIEKARAAKLVALLAELPHEARRRGEELEYALERFVLSGA